MEMLFKSLFGPNTPMVDAPSVRFEETMDTPGRRRSWWAWACRTRCRIPPISARRCT